VARKNGESSAVAAAAANDDYDGEVVASVTHINLALALHSA